jgi:type IX secretion system PorP/SprF family membrane protein
MLLVQCLTIASLLIAIQSEAQIRPLWNDHISNGLQWNPAYAGSHNAVSLGLFYRSQWTGFEDGPSSTMLSVHAPMANASMALGGQLWYDQMGPVNSTVFEGFYAWRTVTRQGTFSLGLSGQIANLRQDLESTDAGQAGDPAFSGQSQSMWTGDAGVGAYYYQDRLMLGASVLNLLNDRQLMLGGAGMISLAADYQLRPSVYGRFVQDGSWQVDAGAHVFFFESFWLGGTWRSNGALAFSVEFVLPQVAAFGSNRWSAGYNYQVSGTDWRSQTGSSHEAFLAFRFTRDQTRELGPRFF